MKQKNSIYRITLTESVKIILPGIALCILCGGLFYKHIIGILILFPILIPLYKSKRTKYKKEIKIKLSLEFRDGISAFLAALEAGFSAENALEEASKDLSLIYDEKAVIRKEFNRIIRQIKAGNSIESAFSDFGSRTGIEEIKNFAEVFALAKRTGGDLIRIIRASESIIADKIEVMREIQTMISGKKLETTIMRWIPLGILAYMNFCNGSYLDPLYMTLTGRLIMSCLLLVYGLMAFVIGKITDISM